jgi:hypothetical protein
MCEHMRNICISQQQLNFFTKKLNQEEIEELLMVLTKSDCGYQIEWVVASISKRKSSSESRSKNRQKKDKTHENISSSYESHMEIEIEIVKEIIERLREVDNVSIQTGQENLYTMIVLKMMDVFKKHNPSYFFHKETDYKACLQIAYNIASMRDWKRDSVLNGNMQPCIQEWENIVQFIKNDRWFSSRSLSDISSTKEWQRINQSINNSKNTTNATDQHVIGKTFKKD